MQKHLDRGPKSAIKIDIHKSCRLLVKLQRKGCIIRALWKGWSPSVCLQECRRRGIAFAEGPHRDVLMQRHRKTARGVYETLTKDKE